MTGSLEGAEAGKGGWIKEKKGDAEKEAFE